MNFSFHPNCTERPSPILVVIIHCFVHSELRSWWHEQLQFELRFLVVCVFFFDVHLNYSSFVRREGIVAKSKTKKNRTKNRSNFFSLNFFASLGLRLTVLTHICCAEGSRQKEMNVQLPQDAWNSRAKNVETIFDWTQCDTLLCQKTIFEHRNRFEFSLFILSCFFVFCLPLALMRIEWKHFLLRLFFGFIFLGFVSFHLSHSVETIYPNESVSFQAFECWFLSLSTLTSIDVEI